MVAHVELSLGELVQKADEQIGRFAEAAERGDEGARGLLAQAEARHQELLQRRERRELALTLQDVERLASALLLRPGIGPRSVRRSACLRARRRLAIHLALLGPHRALSPLHLPGPPCPALVVGRSPCPPRDRLVSQDQALAELEREGIAPEHLSTIVAESHAGDLFLKLGDTAVRAKPGR